MPSTTILTATTGRPTLVRALESVMVQGAPVEHHLLLVDGPDHLPAVRAAVRDVGNPPHVKVLCLPWSTKDWGGTPYAIGSHLLNTDCVGFLDDDNFYDDNHVEHMLECLGDKDYVAAKRILWNPRLRRVAQDAETAVVDTSCFFMKSVIAKQVAPCWTLNGYCHDRTVYHTLKACEMRRADAQYETVYYTVSPKHDKLFL